MSRIACLLVLVFLAAGPVRASITRADEATDRRLEAQRRAQDAERREARERAPSHAERERRAEEEYWRFVAEHEIDADLAYDEEAGEPR